MSRAVSGVTVTGTGSVKAVPDTVLDRAMSMPAGEGLQVDGGEQEIEASINVRWDWAD